MITFTALLFIFVIMAVIAAVGIAIAAGCLVGVGLIVVDIALGCAPFIAVFMVVKWATKKREPEKKETT